MMKSNAAKRLKQIIELVLAGKMDIGDFCEEFERIYNFELEKANLSEKEQQVFETLFNRVVYYSPFAGEREKIPNYLGEDEIIESAKVAQNELR